MEESKRKRLSITALVLAIWMGLISVAHPQSIRVESQADSIQQPQCRVCLECASCSSSRELLADSSIDPIHSILISHFAHLELGPLASVQKQSVGFAEEQYIFRYTNGLQASVLLDLINGEVFIQDYEYWQLQAASSNSHSALHESQTNFAPLSPQQPQTSNTVTLNGPTQVGSESGKKQSSQFGLSDLGGRGLSPDRFFASIQQWQTAENKVTRVLNFVQRVSFSQLPKKDLKLFYVKKYSQNYYRLMYLVRQEQGIESFEIVVYDGISEMKVIKSVEISLEMVIDSACICLEYKNERVLDRERINDELWAESSSSSQGSTSPHSSGRQPADGTPSQQYREVDLRSEEVLALDTFLGQYFHLTYSRLELVKVEKEEVVDSQREQVDSYRLTYRVRKHDVLDEPLHYEIILTRYSHQGESGRTADERFDLVDSHYINLLPLSEIRDSLSSHTLSQSEVKRDQNLPFVDAIILKEFKDELGNEPLIASIQRHEPYYRITYLDLFQRQITFTVLYEVVTNVIEFYVEGAEPSESPEALDEQPPTSDSSQTESPQTDALETVNLSLVQPQSQVLSGTSSRVDLKSFGSKEGSTIQNSITTLPPAKTRLSFLDYSKFSPLFNMQSDAGVSRVINSLIQKYGHGINYFLQLSSAFVYSDSGLGRFSTESSESTPTEWYRLLFKVRRFETAQAPTERGSELLYEVIAEVGSAASLVVEQYESEYAHQPLSINELLSFDNSNLLRDLYYPQIHQTVQSTAVRLPARSSGVFFKQLLRGAFVKRVGRLLPYYQIEYTNGVRVLTWYDILTKDLLLLDIVGSDGSVFVMNNRGIGRQATEEVLETTISNSSNVGGADAQSPTNNQSAILEDGEEPSSESVSDRSPESEDNDGPNFNSTNATDSANQTDSLSIVNLEDTAATQGQQEANPEVPGQTESELQSELQNRDGRNSSQSFGGNNATQPPEEKGSQESEGLIEEQSEQSSIVSSNNSTIREPVLIRDVTDIQNGTEVAETEVSEGQNPLETDSRAEAESNRGQNLTGPPQQTSLQDPFVLVEVEESSEEAAFDSQQSRSLEANGESPEQTPEPTEAPTTQQNDTTAQNLQEQQLIDSREEGESQTTTHTESPQNPSNQGIREPVLITDVTGMPSIDSEGSNSRTVLETQRPQSAETDSPELVPVAEIESNSQFLNPSSESSEIRMSEDEPRVQEVTEVVDQQLSPMSSESAFVSQSPTESTFLGIHIEDRSQGLISDSQLSEASASPREQAPQFSVEPGLIALDRSSNSLSSGLGHGAADSLTQSFQRSLELSSPNGNSASASSVLKFLVEYHHSRRRSSNSEFAFQVGYSTQRIQASPSLFDDWNINLWLQEEPQKQMVNQTQTALHLQRVAEILNFQFNSRYSKEIALHSGQVADSEIKAEVLMESEYRMAGGMAGLQVLVSCPLIRKVFELIILEIEDQYMTLQFRSVSSMKELMPDAFQESCLYDVAAPGEDEIFQYRLTQAFGEGLNALLPEELSVSSFRAVQVSFMPDALSVHLKYVCLNESSNQMIENQLFSTELSVNSVSGIEVLEFKAHSDISLQPTNIVWSNLDTQTPLESTLTDNQLQMILAKLQSEISELTATSQASLIGAVQIYQKDAQLWTKVQKLDSGSLVTEAFVFSFRFESGVMVNITLEQYRKTLNGYTTVSNDQESAFKSTAGKLLPLFVRQSLNQTLDQASFVLTKQTSSGTRILKALFASPAPIEVSFAQNSSGIQLLSARSIKEVNLNGHYDFQTFSSYGDELTLDQAKFDTSYQQLLSAAQRQNPMIRECSILIILKLSEGLSNTYRVALQRSSPNVSSTFSKEVLLLTMREHSQQKSETQFSLSTLPNFPSQGFYSQGCLRKSPNGRCAVCRDSPPNFAISTRSQVELLGGKCFSSVTNCKAQLAYRCMQCKKGYSLDRNRCLKTKDISEVGKFQNTEKKGSFANLRCKTFGTKGQCVECLSSETYILYGNSCYERISPESFPHELKSLASGDEKCYKWSSKICLECVEGAQMVLNRKCQVSTQNCLIYDFSAKECQVCAPQARFVNGRCLNP